MKAHLILEKIVSFCPLSVCCLLILLLSERSFSFVPFSSISHFVLSFHSRHCHGPLFYTLMAPSIFLRNSDNRHKWRTNLEVREGVKLVHLFFFLRQLKVDRVGEIKTVQQRNVWQCYWVSSCPPKQCVWKDADQRQGCWEMQTLGPKFNWTAYWKAPAGTLYPGFTTQFDSIPSLFFFLFALNLC